jgi:nucleoside-diphosphate-sugar epimerase
MNERTNHAHSDTTVLLIGATGYAGRHAAAEFVRAGYRVIALQRPGARVPQSVHGTVKGDLTDPSSLTAAARGFDLVVHVGRIEGEVEREGVEALLASGATLIHTTGSDVLGPGRVYEDSVPNPPPLVGWRADVERAAMQGGGIVVRPGLIYGNSGGVVEEMLRPLAKRLGAGVYLGEPGVRWAAVHVEDLARFYVAIARKAAPGTAWNACSETVRVDELARAVGGGHAVSWPVDQEAPAEIREIAPLFLMDQDVDSEKTRRNLGWSPEYPSIIQYLTEADPRPVARGECCASEARVEPTPFERTS